MRTPYEVMDPEPETLATISVEKYERCSFCNSRLVFSHDFQTAYFQVIEVGQCPGCGVARHPKRFTLH